MIEVIGLTKNFGSTRAVDDLTFTVRPGAVTGFLGPNGAGKSTTMRLILGLDIPTSGQALIHGQRYDQLTRPLTQVGALLDANWVHPNRAARSHLRFLAAANGISTARVDELLETVGLAAVAGKAVGKFSLGMKQRLGLAGALLGDPGVLLFDEPINGLDPEGILWIRTFLKNLAAQGRSVLVSSHLLAEMSLTADHLIVIGRGRLIAEATTTDVIARATGSAVRVRSPQLEELSAALEQAGLAVNAVDGGLVVTGAPIEMVGDLAADRGVTLHELSPVTGSLEEAFMQLTGESVEYVMGTPGAASSGAAGTAPSVPPATSGPVDGGAGGSTGAPGDAAGPRPTGGGR